MWYTSNNEAKNRAVLGSSECSRSRSPQFQDITTYFKRALYLFPLAISLLAFPFSAEAFSSNAFSTSLVAASSQSWSIADASQTGLDFTSDFSSSGWYKFATLTDGQSYRLFSKWNGTNDRSYTAWVNNTSGTITLHFSVNAAGTGGGTAVQWTVTLSTATWYHIAFSYTASGGSAIAYINNVSQGSQSGLDTSVHDGAAPFEIGSINANSVQWFDGSIDDVRVWSRAISSTDVTNLYTTPCTASNGANLQGEWLFENNGTDSSANANNLTNNNSATFTSDVPYTCAAASASYDDTDGWLMIL